MLSESSGVTLSGDPVVLRSENVFFGFQENNVLSALGDNGEVIAICSSQNKTVCFAVNRLMFLG